MITKVSVPISTNTDFGQLLPMTLFSYFFLFPSSNDLTRKTPCHVISIYGTILNNEYCENMVYHLFILSNIKKTGKQESAH